MELICASYGLHVIIAFAAWIASFVLLLICCGAIAGVDLVGLLLTLLCFMWVLSFARFPESCCLEQHVNGAILSVIMVINTFLALAAALNMILWEGASLWQWVPGILWLVNTAVSVCVTSYVCVATRALWPDGATSVVVLLPGKSSPEGSGAGAGTSVDPPPPPPATTGEMNSVVVAQ